MKKILFAALLLMGVYSQAQDKAIQFGLKGGVNFSNVKGDVESIDFKSRSSYHAGILLEIKAFQNFSVQPELLYSVQGAKVESGIASIDDIDFKYLTVPVMAKFYLVTNTLSVDVGPQFAFLMDDNVRDTFETNSFDFGLAGGLTLNLGKNFFLQGRYVAGLTDASKDADIKNTNIQLSLGVKF